MLDLTFREALECSHQNHKDREINTWCHNQAAFMFYGYIQVDLLLLSLNIIWISLDVVFQLFFYGGCFWFKQRLVISRSNERENFEFSLSLSRKLKHSYIVLTELFFRCYCCEWFITRYQSFHECSLLNFFSISDYCNI